MIIFWILFLIIGLVVLSFMLSGGINLEFIKLIVIFVVGVFVLLAIKRIYDSFKK